MWEPRRTGAIRSIGSLTKATPERTTKARGALSGIDGTLGRILLALDTDLRDECLVEERNSVQTTGFVRPPPITMPRFAVRPIKREVR